MSIKKNWFNKRKWRGGGFRRHAPRSWKYWNSWDGRRLTRAKNKQLIREGEYELFAPYHKDAGYYYW